MKSVCFVSYAGSNYVSEVSEPSASVYIFGDIGGFMSRPGSQQRHR